MGDNGAGKSTLVKIIAGNFPPSCGEILLEGEPVHFHKPVEARAQGHRGRLSGPRALRQSDGRGQRLPRPRESSGASARSASSTTARCTSAPRELFAELKSETRPRDLVRADVGRPAPGGRDRPHAAVKAKIVLMDEPTAAISVRQVAEVLDLIRRLRDQGIAIVLISHRMPDVFAVADRIVVMRRGRKVAEKPIGDSSPGRGDRPDHRRDPARLTTWRRRRRRRRHRRRRSRT